MAKQTIKSLGAKVLSCILFLLFIAGIVGAIVHFTGVDNSVKDLLNSTFRVEYNGIEYASDGDNVAILPENGTARFNIKNGGNCAVRVVPNVDFKFDFGGEELSFKDEVDLTRYFIDSSGFSAGCFEINCTPNAFKISSFLSTIYGDAVSVPDNLSNEEYYYKVYVTAASGETISILLAQAPFIRIEQDNVAF